MSLFEGKEEGKRNHPQNVTETSLVTTGHPFVAELEDRPEVYNAEVFDCGDHHRAIITFDGWGMPDGFEDDYDLEIESFYVNDPRSLLKRMFSMEVGPRLEISARREKIDLRQEADSQ